MFDIGFWELVVVGVVSLLVLGPERLPQAVRTTARWLRWARNLVAQVKADIERELAVDEVKQSLQQENAFAELKRLEQELRQPSGLKSKAPARLETASLDDHSP